MSTDAWGNPDLPDAAIVARFKRVTWATDTAQKVDASIALMQRMDAVGRHDVNWVLDAEGYDDTDPEGPARHDSDFAWVLWRAVTDALAGWRERQVSGPVPQAVTALRGVQ